MSATQTEWRCDRCEVTARWMAGFERTLPSTWIVEDGLVHCLACRRALAGEAGIGEHAMTPAGRVRARRDATVEFEIGRNAERSNQVIARACGTSAAVVAGARRSEDEYA